MKGRQQKQRKSGVTIQKGQTCYVTGGTGRMLVLGHALLNPLLSYSLLLE